MAYFWIIEGMENICKKKSKSEKRKKTKQKKMHFLKHPVVGRKSGKITRNNHDFCGPPGKFVDQWETRRKKKEKLRKPAFHEQCQMRKNKNKKRENRNKKLEQETKTT